MELRCSIVLLIFACASLPVVVTHGNHAAQERDRIVGLPGEPKHGPKFGQYAGYVPVATNGSTSRALFYWLNEASTPLPHKRPLVLWLNGGPGCSSLAYGAAEEIGPYRVDANGTGLYNNPYAWNTVANLLFLESPAGVGYSYSNTSTNLDEFGDIRTAEDAYVFLIRWFERFPQYKGREFFIAGESYAGHYVPQLAKLVYDGNKGRASTSVINLKGFMVGNAVTDWFYDNMGIIDYYWTHALISDETYASMTRHCDWNNVQLNSRCEQIMDYASNEEIGNVDLHSIYTPVCLEATWASSKKKRHWNPLWMGQAGFDPCTPSYAEKYFNRPDVQQALHASTGTSSSPHSWTPCNYGILENWQDKAFSVLPIYRELIKAGLRIWVYSGDEDAMVPVTGTRYWIRSLQLPVQARWYPWYHMDQVAGWTQVYQGLTFATVRGAGHEVPVLQPDRALALVASYLNGKPLPRR